MDQSVTFCKQVYRVLRFMSSNGGLYRAYRVLTFKYGDGRLDRAYMVLRFV